MIFFLVYIFMIFGFIIAGIGFALPGLLPGADVVQLQIMMLFMGIIVSFMGVFILQSRASKTGVNKFLEFGKPSTIKWFYIHRDGTIQVTDAMREVEGQLTSPELDMMIHELKSYRLYDHSVRFVPEGTGHAVDVGMCLYVDTLHQHGISNIREGREWFKIHKELPKESIYRRSDDKDENSDTINTTS